MFRSPNLEATSDATLVGNFRATPVSVLGTFGAASWLLFLRQKSKLRDIGKSDRVD